MATETLIPDGDVAGQLGTWTRFPASTTWAAKIADAPASHDSDTSYVQGPNTTANPSTMWVTLSNTGGTFDPSGVTGITVDVVHRHNSAGVSNGVDSITVFYQVFKSDRTTALTNEVSTGAALATTYARAQLSATQQGTPSKADWDGAVLSIRSEFAASGMADTTASARVTAARVLVDWEAGQNFSRTVDDSLGLLDDRTVEQGIARSVDDVLGLVDDQTVDVGGGGDTIELTVKRVILVDLVD